MGVCAAIGAILATWAALCASSAAVRPWPRRFPAPFCDRLGVILAALGVFLATWAALGVSLGSCPTVAKALPSQVMSSCCHVEQS